MTKYKQKRVDNLLTVDLTRAIWKDNISEAILIIGDSDFVPAVEEANRAQILTHDAVQRQGYCARCKRAGGDLYREGEA